METKETNCHPKPLVNATCLLGEKGCYKDGKCHYLGNCEHKVLTNADRIRAMSDEELAEFLCGVYDDDNCGVYQDECGKFINGTIIIDYDQNKLLEWLKQPAEGD